MSGTDHRSGCSDPRWQAAPCRLALQPGWPNDEERVREWWLGFNKESAARQRKEEEERAWSRSRGQRAQGGGSGNGQCAGLECLLRTATASVCAVHGVVAASSMAGSNSSLLLPQWHRVSSPKSRTVRLQSILAAINQPSQQQPAHAQPAQCWGLRTVLPDVFARVSRRHRRTLEIREPERGESQHGKGEHKDARDARKKKGTLPPHKPVNKALIGTKAVHVLATRQVRARRQVYIST